MKKSASPVKTEISAKRTPEEKSARKSAKKASRATANLNDERDTKKASQKKSLKSAAKQLQKELNGRMNEVVARIRKETKDKLKEVLKEATRRLDGDTESMFEQALHTIVRHYDSISNSASATSNSETSTVPAAAKSGAGRTGKKSKTLNKDGSPRKARAARDTTDATETDYATPALKIRGHKAGATAAKAKTTSTGARRGPKPKGTAAPINDSTATSAEASPRGPKPSPSGARRGPKPRTQAVPETTDVLNSADSPSTGEASE